MEEPAGLGPGMALSARTHLKESQVPLSERERETKRQRRREREGKDRERER